MQLNEDLRNIQLGDLSITKYCHKIKVISDLLENIGKPIDETTLVMHTVNGLSEKYEQIAGIIRYQKPLPSFVDTRAMLELEESRLNRTRYQPSIKETSSAPSVLLAKNNNNNNNTNRNNYNNSQPCRNFQRGYCNFGERCRFLHGNTSRNNNRQAGNRNNNSSGNNFYSASQAPPSQYFGPASTYPQYYFGPASSSPASYGNHGLVNYDPPAGYGNYGPLNTSPTSFSPPGFGLFPSQSSNTPGQAPLSTGQVQFNGVGQAYNPTGQA